MFKEITVNLLDHLVRARMDVIGPVGRWDLPRWTGMELGHDAVRDRGHCLCFHFNGHGTSEEYNNDFLCEEMSECMRGGNQWKESSEG